LLIHLKRKSLFFIIKNCRLPAPYCKLKLLNIIFFGFRYEFCIAAKKEKEAEQEARIDGYQKMRYILHAIEEAKEEIRMLERKIERERREKRQNYEIVIGMAEYDI
jgi:hypothetical protein